MNCQNQTVFLSKLLQKKELSCMYGVTDTAAYLKCYKKLVKFFFLCLWSPNVIFGEYAFLSLGLFIGPKSCSNQSTIGIEDYPVYVESATEKLLWLA